MRLASRDSWPEGVGPPCRVISWQGSKQALCPSRQCWACVFTTSALIPAAPRWLGHTPLLNTSSPYCPSEKDNPPTWCLWTARKPWREPGGSQGGGRHHKVVTWEPGDPRRGSKMRLTLEGRQYQCQAGPGGYDSGPPQFSPSTLAWLPSSSKTLS